MRIGILSDTHGYFHPDIPRYLAGSDLILHAGDVGTPDILDALEAIAPVRAVYGNIDGQSIRHRAPLTQSFEADGLRYLMIHIGGHPGRWGRGVPDLLKRERPDVFVCGHSHILRIERVASLGRMLYVNPGAAGQQGFHQKKTLVLLHSDAGSLTKADVVHLDG